MKNWMRGLLVSLLALGSVGAASTVARAEEPGTVTPACADIVNGGPEYAGDVYVGPTSVTTDSIGISSTDPANATLLATLPVESEGTVTVTSDLAAPACAEDVTYRLRAVYADGTFDESIVYTTGETPVDLVMSVDVDRHATNCIDVELVTLDTLGQTLDRAPDGEGFARVCTNDGAGVGNWR